MTIAVAPAPVRVTSAERRALESFFNRHLPELRSWAARRVPRWLERRADVDDFVQIAAIRTLGRLRHLSSAQLATMQPYMRRVVINLVRDELRKVGRTPEVVTGEDVEGASESPLDVLVGRARWDSYRAGLRRLSSRDRRCIVARIQNGQSYASIAELIAAPSKGAARVATTRAMKRLLLVMRKPARPNGRRRARS